MNVNSERSWKKHTRSQGLARLPMALTIGSRNNPIIAVNTQLITNPRQLALRRGTQDLGGGNLKSLGKESWVEVMSKERKRERRTPTQDEQTNPNSKTPEESCR